MRHILLSLIFLLSFLQASGQAKQHKADDHFARLEYFSAAPIYTELAKKTVQGKGKVNWENVRRAAYTNKQIFQYNRARYYYGKLHETNRLTETDYVEYIDILRTIGKYEVADELLADAVKAYPANDFVTMLKGRNNDFGYLLTDSSVYAIEALSINSGIGDFSPTFYDKGILYMSKAKNAGFLNTRYGWDNAFFINMLYSPYDLDSTLIKGKILKDAFFSRAHDGPVSFSPDGKRMVITKNTLGKHNDQEVVVLAIYFSDLVNGEWSEVTPFPFNNAAYNVGHACFAADGNRIYFASDQEGGQGGADLYYSELINGTWSAPVNLGPAINTDQDELFPSVSGSTLYFASKGHFGIGGLDIFTTPINLTGAVTNMGFPINTSYDDFGIIARPDEKGGFFSTNRGDFIDRIYSWERKDPLIRFEGSLFYAYTEKEAVPDHWVTFEDRTAATIDTLFSDSSGNFSVQLFLNHDYRFSTGEDYFALQSPLEISTAGIMKDTTIRGELMLKPLTIMVTLRVVERGTQKVIPNAKTTISNLVSSADTVLLTNEQGEVTLRVDRYTDYMAHATKRGYVDDESKFHIANEDGKVVELLLQLPQIKKGDKFKLENIFYDYNKSTLRPESMAALDKLAAFIMENKLKIELSSHTDARGSGPANQRLSQARAQSCVDYLIKKGVPANMITAKGYGETQLLNRCKDGVTNCTEAEHQENRRSEIKIL